MSELLDVGAQLTGWDRKTVVRKVTHGKGSGDGGKGRKLGDSGYSNLLSAPSFAGDDPGYGGLLEHLTARFKYASSERG